MCRTTTPPRVCCPVKESGQGFYGPVEKPPFVGGVLGGYPPTHQRTNATGFEEEMQVEKEEAVVQEGSWRAGRGAMCR